MTRLTYLPRRPLRRNDSLTLNDDEWLMGVTYGYIPRRPRAWRLSLKRLVYEMFCALASDEALGRWSEVYSLSASSRSEAHEAPVMIG